MPSVPSTTNVEFEPLLGEVYSMQHYVIKLVSDLRQTNNIDRHNITEILLKVALNTINLKLLTITIRVIPGMLLLENKKTSQKLV